MKNNSYLSIRRLVFVLIILQVGFLLLVGKLFKVLLSNDAARQGPTGHPWGSTPTAAIKRGKILDRHGHVFALSRHSLSVYADPTYMKTDPSEAARRLAPVLGVPESELLLKLRRRDKRFVMAQKGYRLRVT